MTMISVMVGEGESMAALVEVIRKISEDADGYARFDTETFVVAPGVGAEFDITSDDSLRVTTSVVYQPDNVMSDMNMEDE